MLRVSNLKISIEATKEAELLKETLLKKIAKAMAVPKFVIEDYMIVKRSLDARKKTDVFYVYTVDVVVSDEERILKRVRNNQVVIAPNEAYEFVCEKIELEKRPIVVGFGPSGMFAGLLLAEMGAKPIILERGFDVDTRKKDVERFWEEGILNPESNVQFGEGGAGTFSDGKLTTRSKDKRCKKVLEELVSAGAKEEILWEAKPHIGTDLLQGVVKNIREKIIALGGEVRFGAKVSEILVENQEIQGVLLEQGERLLSDTVVLAVGHSARDTFEMLHEKEMKLEQKPFAMGVRIEHKQDAINRRQHGEFSQQLPPAEYALTYTTSKKRAVYTFCMCPGGYVVGASSEEGHLSINGMSYNKRDGENANSAVLVQIMPTDFPTDTPLSGMEFQRELERKAFEIGGGDYTAPIQRVGDFLKQKDYSKEDMLHSELNPTYRPKQKEIDMRDIFPNFMIEALKEALPEMGKKLKGFDAKESILTAVESRSSSPVRMVRLEDGMSENMKGLYPIGEGAGYAGGIVSAGIDGILVAERIAKRSL